MKVKVFTETFFDLEITINMWLSKNNVDIIKSTQTSELVSNFGNYSSEHIIITQTIFYNEKDI